MKHNTEREFKKLLDNYDPDDVLQSTWVFLLLEDIALGIVDPKHESRLKEIAKQYINKEYLNEKCLNEEYLNDTVSELDDLVLEVALAFYNRVFEYLREEKISFKEFKEFFHHRIGVAKVDQKSYEDFAKKIHRAYSWAF